MSVIYSIILVVLMVAVLLFLVYGKVSCKTSSNKANELNAMGSSAVSACYNCAANAWLGMTNSMGSVTPALGGYIGNMYFYPVLAPNVDPNVFVKGPDGSSLYNDAMNYFPVGKIAFAAGTTFTFTLNGKPVANSNVIITYSVQAPIPP